MEDVSTLTFDGEVLQHVATVVDLPEIVFKDFCRLALDYLHRGPNTKRYNIAAEKLNKSPTEISNAVKAIVHLLICTCKYNLDDKDLDATLAQLGLSEPQKTSLIKFATAKRDSIKRQLSRLNVNLPEFNNLEWRLEAQVASRSLPDRVFPSVLLDLSLQSHVTTETNTERKSQGTVSHKLLHCDVANLDNVISNLETALRETKFYHAKKIKTAITKN